MSNYRLYGDAKANATTVDHGRKQKALQQAEQRYQQSPTPANQASLASALFDNGRYDEAEKLLSQLLAEHGEDVHVLFELGFIYKNLGRNPEAIQTWLKLVEVNPKHSLSRAAENEVWMLDPGYKPSWLRR
ncbi:tetratricopeptide repeat protein [bacterium]|nr:tetratricopeptide repeat protein [bacterium]